MKQLLLAAALAVPGATSVAPPIAAEPVPVVSASDGTGIPGHYIVTLRGGATDVGVAPSRGYTSVMRGFAAAMDAAQLEAVRRHPDVVAIEQDRRWSLDSAEGAGVQAQTQTPTPNWGLDRIDQRALPLNNTFVAPHGGAQVRAYILDTGTDSAHPEFGGRATSIYDAFPNEPANCESHGTWTGGIVGSAHFGVAKQVLIQGMRVFDCQSQTTTSILISAMDFINTHGVKPAVVNMSFGGDASPSLDAAAKALWDNRFFVSASAGNLGIDACGHSPSRAVYAVAASNVQDGWTYNHGPCVDIFAPGLDISATAPNGGFYTGSGTSAAAPFVTGAAALYKAMFGDAPSDTVASWLNANATIGAIKEPEPGTPNRLLFIPPGAAPSSPDGTYAYVYANDPDKPDYIPGPAFQRNTTGGINRVTRSGTGTYRVHLPGLAGTGGMAHAALANSVGGVCQIASEGSDGPEQFLDVRCFGVDGQPADARFTASYTRPAAGLSGAFGYVRATLRAPGPGGPVYGAGVSYNSTGQQNSVTRLDAGRYRVDLPGLGVPGGTVVVSAFGPDPRSCTPFDWDQLGTIESVVVHCRDLTGAFADSLFAVTFANTRSILGTAAVRGHAWVPELGPGTPSHTPSPIWAFNSSGGPIKVTRDGLGKYEVVFAGLASSTRGQPVATATGATSARCRTSGWDNTGTDQWIDVRCFTAAGQPADAEFTVQFVW